MDIPLNHELLNEVLSYLGKQQYQDVYILIAKFKMLLISILQRLQPHLRRIRLKKPTHFKEDDHAFFR